MLQTLRIKAARARPQPYHFILQFPLPAIQRSFADAQILFNLSAALAADL